MRLINRKEYSQFLEDSKKLIESYDFEIEKTERGFKIKTFLGVLNISFWETDAMCSCGLVAESSI